MSTPAPAQRPDFAQIANAQRMVLRLTGGVLGLAILKAGLAAMLHAPQWMLSIMTIGQLGLWAALVWGVWKLAQACNQPRTASLLHAAGMLVPIVNLAVLVIANMRAAKMLQEGGVAAGFLGVSREQMSRLAAASCASCGYKARGVTQPNCPDCGKDLRQRQAA